MREAVDVHYHGRVDGGSSLPFNTRVNRPPIGSSSSGPHSKYQYPARSIEWASTMLTTRVRWLSDCPTRQVEAPLSQGDRPGGGIVGVWIHSRILS